MEKVESRNKEHASQAQLGEDATKESVVMEPRKGKHHSFYLSILMLSMIALIISWDVTALSLALPVIANQLHGTNFQSFWASIAFILGVAATQPIYASVSDVVGRKYALYVSIMLFAIGCIVFSTAKDMNIVIVGRLIKGLGAGGIDVLQTIILCDITTLKERPKWLGVLSMANAIGAVTGPFIGGGLATQTLWPWLGWINLITAGATAVLTFFFLHLTPMEGNIRDQIRGLDWSGFVLFIVISTIVALPLSWASTLYAWGSWQTLVPLIIGLVLLVPFAFVEKRAAMPMIPYKIFDNISIIAGTVSGFLYGASMNAILLYIPLFYQAVYLETPLEAASSTLPLCCLFVGLSIIVSMLIDWSRKYLLASRVGWVLTTVFLGLNYTIGADSGKPRAYAFQALLGAGLGTALVATMLSVLASVRRVDDVGLAVGMLVTTRFIGTLIGLAICSTVFSSIFQKSLSTLHDLPEQIAVLRDGSQAVGFIPQLRDISISEDVMRVVIGAYEDAFQTIWIVLAAFSGLGVLLSLLTKENSLEKDDVGRQGFQAPPPE
ncbi:major facilitator superfamily domain-containing protein [Trichoderma evansii]